MLGALPLGEVVTTREDTDTVAYGFRLLKSILPENAFYGRGLLGPSCFMTDDSDAERNALSDVWPLVFLLLCAFHVLQAMWTWIWEAKHGIKTEDKGHLIQLIRIALFTENYSELRTALENLHYDPIASE